jgi:hypothetical protein
MWLLDAIWFRSDGVRHDEVDRVPVLVADQFRMFVVYFIDDQVGHLATCTRIVMKPHWMLCSFSVSTCIFEYNTMVGE